MQLPAFRQKQFLRILLAWLLPIPACLLQWAFHAETGPSPWLLFLPVLVFSPIIGGFWGGLGATLISSLLAWYIFLPPAFSFAVTGVGLPLSVILFVATGIVFSFVYDRLRDRDRKYRLLFHCAGDGIVRVSRQGVVLDANERFATMLQRTRRELIGTPVTAVVAGMTPPVWGDIDRRLQAAGELSEQQQLWRADGETVPVETTMTMLHGSEHLVIVRDISERTRAELALRESEAKFARLFQATPVPLNLSHLESGNFVDANDAFVAQYGYRREELIGRSSLEIGLFSANTRAVMREELERQGRLQSVDVQITCKSGEVRNCLCSIEILDLATGPHLLISTVDISERRRLEQAVAASEERLRWAMDATSEGLWDWNILTGAVVGNDQWHRLFGYEPGETPATIDLWSSTLHPADASATYQVLDDYLQGRRPDYASEHRVVTKSGDVRWHLSVGKLVGWDADGQPSRMVGTNADITARKLAELQLRHSEERFRFIVENAPIAIAIWGEDGALRYVSAAVESDLGLSPAELVEAIAAVQAQAADVALAEFTPEWLEATGIDDPLYARAGLRAVETVRYCLAHPGEKVWIEETLPHAGGGAVDMQFIYQSLTYNTTGNEVVTVAYDISEHRALERLLRETNVELERQVAARTAQLQETVAELRRANGGKDAFLAAVSHELRTPIMGVLSMGELLESEERGPLNADQARYVKALVVSGQRLLGAINSILLYTQVMTGAVTIQKGLCYLDELCAVAARAIAPKAARKQQRLTHAVEPPGTEIVSDAQSLLNLLRVLLDNAVKFTPVGGSIDLIAAATPGGRLVHFAVADTGIGMSEEQVARLFRPFVQGDLTLARRFDGLGLGLAYAVKMAELLGGSLTVASAPGQGSRFTLTLPRE